jgi:hypothetical protein
MFLWFSESQRPPKFPNIGYIGQGYDLLYGNPQTPQASADPGFRNAVYNLTYSGQQTADGRFQVPDGTQVLPITSCIYVFSVDQISGVQAYSQSISKSIDVGYSGIIFTFGMSKSYQQIMKSVSKEQHVYTKAVAWCTAYNANILTYTPPTLTDNFIEVRKRFPNSFRTSAKRGWVFFQRTSRFARLVRRSFKEGRLYPRPNGLASMLRLFFSYRFFTFRMHFFCRTRNTGTQYECFESILGHFSQRHYWTCFAIFLFLQAEYE